MQSFLMLGKKEQMELLPDTTWYCVFFSYFINTADINGMHAYPQFFTTRKDYKSKEIN